MYTILPSMKPNVVAIKFSEKAAKKDYETIIPYLENKIKQYGKINLYWEMEHFNGWDLGALWEETKFDIQHAKDFSRVAVVGDSKWEEWLTKAMKPFTSAAIKFYRPEQKQEAMQWVEA